MHLDVEDAGAGAGVGAGARDVLTLVCPRRRFYIPGRGRFCGTSFLFSCPRPS